MVLAILGFSGGKKAGGDALEPPKAAPWPDQRSRLLQGPRELVGEQLRHLGVAFRHPGSLSAVRLAEAAPQLGRPAFVGHLSQLPSLRLIS